MCKIQENSGVCHKCTGYMANGDRCSEYAKKDGLCTRHYNIKVQEEMDKTIPRKKCIAIGQRTGIPCKKDARKGELCEIHNKLKVEGIQFRINPNRNEEYYQYLADKERDEEAYKKCNGNFHSYLISSYPKDKVPSSMFQKPDSEEYYETCMDCRTEGRRKISELKKLADMKNNEKYRVCTTSCHEWISDHPFDNVPAYLFLSDPEDPESELLVNCKDCRDYIRINRKNYMERKAKTLVDGQILCLCGDIVNKEDISINDDGTESTMCHYCKEDLSKRRKKRREKYLDFVYNEILKSNCSCSLCKCIFLKPADGTRYAITLNTYEENGERLLKFKNETYKVSEFLLHNKDLLELLILEFDHLSEKEQRERGLLKADEIYEAKKGDLGSLNKKDRTKEVKKTQLICCKCHVIETIKREIENRNGEPQKNKTPSEREKTEYINEIKKSGCSCCGFYDETLLRFLEFDHLNPLEKVAEICAMKMSLAYSLQDLIEEIKKCRILCRHCHKIHTAKQNKDGLSYKKLKLKNLSRSVG